jgi:hypothetical protein
LSIQPANFRFSRSLFPPSHAYADVRLRGPTGKYSSIITTLLDSGASYSGFDSALVAQAGYNIANLPSMSIVTANAGSTLVSHLAPADVEIEGVVYAVNRILVFRSNANPILSPSDFLLHSEFGFDQVDFFFD